MLVLIQAAKGGVGATTFAASLALAEPHRPSLLVDLAGDLHLALGVDVGDRPGVVDWLRSDATPGQLDELVHHADGLTEIEILPAGVSPFAARDVPEARWAAMARWLIDRSSVDGAQVVIDAGTQPVGLGLADACPHRLLVARRCFLTLRRSITATTRPTGAVLISEAGRSLRRIDVERALACPIIGEIAHDIGLANRVDAGLVDVGRPPRAHVRSLRSIWRRLESNLDRAVAA